MDGWFTTLGEHGGHTHTREVDTGNTAAEREREDTRVSPSRYVRSSLRSTYAEVVLLTSPKGFSVTSLHLAVVMATRGR